MNESTRMFAAITVISTLTSVGGYFLAPIEVRFLKTLTESTALIGLTYSVGAVLFAIFSIYLGRLSASFGKRRLITAGAFAGIFYPVLFANTVNVFQYMGVKFIWAFAGASTGPLLAALLQDTLHGKSKKGTLLGLFHSVHAIAGSAGALVGGYLSDAYSLVTPYYAESYFLILPALLSVIFIGFRDEAKIQNTTERKSLLFSLRYVFSKPMLVFHIVLNTVFSLNWSVKAIIYPLVVYGMTKSDTITGSVFATMGVVAMFVLPYAGRFVDRHGPVDAAKAGYLILGVSSLALSFSTSIWLFWFFAALFSVGEAFNGPVRGVIEIENIESMHRGEILGFYTAWESVVGALSPLLAGLLLGVLSEFSVLFIYSAFIWVGLLVAVRILAIKQKTG